MIPFEGESNLIRSRGGSGDSGFVAATNFSAGRRNLLTDQLEKPASLSALQGNQGTSTRGRPPGWLGCCCTARMRQLANAPMRSCLLLP